VEGLQLEASRLKQDVAAADKALKQLDAQDLSALARLAYQRETLAAERRARGGDTSSSGELSDDEEEGRCGEAAGKLRGSWARVGRSWGLGQGERGRLQAGGGGAGVDSCGW
jgi:hypothetical protein